jgi:hypothetical protein
MAFDNTEQIENTEKQSFINSGNVETIEEGTVCTTTVNRRNAKYNILYKCLLCCLDDTVVKFFSNQVLTEEENTRYNAYKRVCREIDNLSTGDYTVPHYGVITSKEIDQTLTANFKENNILATLNAILYGDFEQNGAEIDDKYKCKDIILKENEALPASEDNNEMRKKYSITEALEDIKKQLVVLYPNDSLVNEVLSVIKSGDKSKLDSLLKVMIGIITEKTYEEEQEIGNTKISFTKSSYNFSKSNLNGETKNNTKKVSVADDIEFNVSDIKTQETYKNNSDERMQRMNDVLANKRIDYALVNSKRYYINKNTGYVYETPDKNIELLTYDDDVRIYNGKKWFDKSHNAVLIRSDTYSDRKIVKGSQFVFSFFDPDKGSYIYSNPFTDKITEANIKAPEKTIGGPESINKKNKDNPPDVNNSYLNIILDNSILALRLKDPGLYQTNKEFFEKYKLSIDPDNDPLVLDKMSDTIDSLKKVRAYGYKNMLSDSVVDNVYMFCQDYKDIAEATDLSRLGLQLSQAEGGLGNIFRFVADVTDVDKKQNLLKNICKWYMDLCPNSITTISYKDGVELSRNEKDIKRLKKSDIFADCGVIIDQTGVSQGSSSFLNSINGEENKTNCMKIFNEDFEHKKYKSDLASIAYNNKDIVKQQEEYLKNYKENLNDVKRKKANSKRVQEFQKNAEKEYNEEAVNEAKRAASKINNIKEMSLWDKVKKIFYWIIGEDYKTKDERIFNNYVRSIKNISENAVFNKKDASQIQSIIDQNREKLNIDKVPEIIFKVNTNLNNARKGSKKKI